MKNSEQVTGRQWAMSASLLVVADIATTLAQFLPMKSVFILATGDIPSFFPQFLTDAGPILAALSLVAAAGMCGLIAGFAREWSGAVAGSMSTLRSDRGVSTSGRPIPTVTVKQLTSIALVVVLLVSAAIVSWLFALVVGLWVAMSAVILAAAVHRGTRKPPFPSGIAQFDREFRTWMNQSSLWSAVGAAILTLLITPPALGLTGILLGAVVLRRFQQVTPDLIPVLFSVVASKNSGGGGLGIVTHPLRSPYEFIGTPVGRRLFEAGLRELGLETYSWQVCGRPDNGHLAVACREKTSGQWRILKLFSSEGHARLRHEWELRENWREYLPSHVENLREIQVAGLPALDMTFPKGRNPKPEVPTKRGGAMGFQLEWELACLMSQPLQQTLQGFPCADPEEFLYPRLGTASRIRGSHTSDVIEVMKQFSAIRNDYLAGPRVFDIGKADLAGNMLRLEGAAKEFIDLSEWSVSLFGATWTNGEASLEFMGKFLPQGSLPADIVASAFKRQKVHSLSRALRTRNIVAIQRDARALLDLLKS